MASLTLPSFKPDIRLYGSVCDQMLTDFFTQKDRMDDSKPVLLELSTMGGDADMGRRIAQEVRLLREIDGREVFFLGKSFVYSAGLSIMAAIEATHRFLTNDCELLIHERRIKQDIHLDGSLRTCLSAVQDIIREIESGQRLERDGFKQLTAGTPMSLPELEAKLQGGSWYLSASQAKEAGLVADVV